MPAVRRAYYDDSYQKSLAATVTQVDGDWIELDQTIFYPLGGGQPGDTGTLVAPDLCSGDSQSVSEGLGKGV